MALDYFPLEKKYWRYLAQAELAKEDYKAGTAAFEIATRIALPDKKNEWRTLIDLYNYLGLPLRTAESIQIGLDLLAEESTKEEQQLAIAEAYARGARVDKAVSYLDSVIAKAPSYKLRIKKATILYEARRNAEAIAALDACIDMKSNAYDAQYMKGWVAWDMKDWKMAKKAFGEASNARDENMRYISENALEMLVSLDEARAK
jgi:tetratricopeptide (TPR) repeat protein